MDNAVVFRHHTVVCQSEVLGVLCQCGHLLGADRVFNGFVLVVCWCVVVGHTEDMVGTETFQSSGSHALESLR